MKPDRVPREIPSLNVRSKPWKGICSARCWNSRGNRCRCKCKGFYHGVGAKGKPQRITEYISG